MNIFYLYPLGNQPDAYGEEIIEVQKHMLDELRKISHTGQRRAVAAEQQAAAAEKQPAALENLRHWRGSNTT